MLLLTLGAVAMAAASTEGCSDSEDGRPSPQGSGAAGGAIGAGGQGQGGDGAGGELDPPGGPPYADFPATPILDTPEGGAPPPSDVADLFGPAGSGELAGGPCLIEPALGTLFPNNWLRPRFRFLPAGNQNLFEIRLSAPNQASTLVVYTSATEWKMPLSMWQSLATHSPDVPITVSIRGAELANGALVGSPAAGAAGEIQIAPVSAAGSIVYWRTVPATNTGELKGFSVGAESAVVALRTEQVEVRQGGNGVTCLGCHTSTPDGKYAAFKTLGATSGGALASVSADTAGQMPPFWSTASIEAMSPAELGIPTFSKAHWRDGDYTLLTSWGNGAGARLAWFDLQATASGEGESFGFLERTGDPSGGIMPSFSHDGERIVYTSTGASVDGRPASAPTDLYLVPFAGRLLAHVFVDTSLLDRGPAAAAALHHGVGGGGGHHHDVSCALPLESTGRRGEPHAGVGRLRYS